MASDSERKWSPADGVFSHNPLFAAGMGIAPAAAVCTTLGNSLAYSAFFSAVTLVTLMISSFLPRKIPYALRIILYTLICAAVYIPVYFFLDGRLAVGFERLGVLLPMTVTGELIVSASELRFFRMSRWRMTADIISHIIGFDAAVIFLGAIRELFSLGGIGGELYGITSVTPILSAPCGAFILIGFAGALIRLLRRALTRRSCG